MAQRNASAAVVVAVQNFGDDAEVITMVMVVAVLGLVVLFATAGELGKRASKTAPQAGDVAAKRPERYGPRARKD